MSVDVVLFTADLRVHDHPPLRAALAAADEVVPLFVRDRAIRRAGFVVPNRAAFLADCLTDLDASLRARGGRLVLRSGDVVDEVCRVAAETGARTVHMAAGVSRYAAGREARLQRALADDGRELRTYDEVITAVGPGTLVPAGSDHFAVFTPYHRRWASHPLRDALPAPRRVPVPADVGGDPLPERDRIGGVSPRLARGGETRARKALTTWTRSGLAAYEDLHDDLAADGTSRLSPHLHFGTLSAVETVRRAAAVDGAGARAFVRQLCWRDFHHQVLAARPEAAVHDYRDRHDHWRTETDPDAAHDIRAWREGRTGYPIVDAAMRQLAAEGWMHNRGRLLTAGFLTKTLYVDWRIGARHFLDLLVDGDVADNQLNWQWTAGTGTDTRPGRVLNPVLQARRHDPDGRYVRRWLPELAGMDPQFIHTPWTLPGLERARYDYPDPIVDLAAGRDRFLAARDGRGERR